jgi:cytochrome c-type biogenesis protein CcmH
MSGFIVIAGALTLAALVALLFPLLRRREGSTEAWRSGGIVAVLVAVGAAALYPYWSNFDWQRPAPAADSPEAMVGRLARRLEKQPDDLAGWLRLGRSYSVLQQWPLAVRAYERANKLAKEQNAEAALGLGEALYNSERSDLAGRSGQLFEQALKLEPTSVKALFYSALAASERNELPLARERFTRLLQADPPDNVREVIRQHIQALESMEKMAASAPDAPAAARPGVAAAAAAQPPAAAAAAVVKVPLRVTLAAGVAAKAKKGAPLFVLARVPGQRGAPLAVRRLESTFPQEVELLSSDAMVAGIGFTAGQDIEIEARVANGGGAISVSGDPFGTVRLKAGEGGRASVEINQLKP